MSSNETSPRAQSRKNKSRSRGKNRKPREQGKKQFLSPEETLLQLRKETTRRMAGKVHNGFSVAEPLSLPFTAAQVVSIPVEEGKCVLYYSDESSGSFSDLNTDDLVAIESSLVHTSCGLQKSSLPRQLSELRRRTIGRIVAKVCAGAELPSALTLFYTCSQVSHLSEENGYVQIHYSEDEPGPLSEITTDDLVQLEANLPDRRKH